MSRRLALRGPRGKGCRVERDVVAFGPPIVWGETKNQARQFSLETALDHIEDDELVEVTPKSIRLRKISLKENDRKRLARAE